LSEITYVRIAKEHAKALEELELSVFNTIDPGDLYHEDELIELAEIFPEGNFVALDDGRPIGMGLGILVDFDFEHTQHSLADVVTDDEGNNAHRPENLWYYGTDISVYPEYRGRGVGRRLYELRKEYVRAANKAGIVAGGVIPGYANHINDMTANEYIAKVAAGELTDPTLTFQMGNGFEPRGAIADYLDDSSVGNNAVLIVWSNPDYTG
jgi:GNAT superfamily N-acetyltransferase